MCYFSIFKAWVAYRLFLTAFCSTYKSHFKITQLVMKRKTKIKHVFSIDRDVFLHNFHVALWNSTNIFYVAQPNSAKIHFYFILMKELAVPIQKETEAFFNKVTE